MQVHNELDDNVTLSDLASGRLKRGLQKCALVDDVTEDANSSDNHRHQEHVAEINCVG